MLFSLATTMAHAAVGVTHTDASGAPGGLAKPTLAFDIGTDYPFSSISMELTYDSSMLTFMTADSSVKTGADTLSFNDFISALNSVSSILIINDSSPGLYALSAGTLLPLPVSGPVEFTLAFKLANGFSSPSAVAYSGLISGNDEDSFNGSMNISAVPEPEVWLLWLSGLGLLATRTLRRRA